MQIEKCEYGRFSSMQLLMLSVHKLHVPLGSTLVHVGRPHVNFVHSLQFKHLTTYLIHIQNSTQNRRQYSNSNTNSNIPHTHNHAKFALHV